ncbi:hypothetical protein C6503_01390 [Candidatus Poribacteria bacterium]|nr:MAG: hypothetical protein C6503_01390 [Candidatus Poribacteria bacterium]
MMENDIQLIHRILSGDEAAFSALVRKYQKSVHALAWRKVGDFHIAEEIAQDAFLQAYKNLATLRNPSQFAGWLYVIANNLCKRWHQSSKPAMQSLEATSVAEVGRSSYKRYVLEQREAEAVEHRYEIVKELLEKLPESERTVVTLHYLGEMTVKEIGNFLGVSVNTIKSRIRRARKRLQAEEHLISETLGSVQLSTDFIERIMRQVADIKPTPPQVGKPLLPWAAFGTAAVFILLMLGVGSQYLARFQKPYNLNAQSETTVEIIDVPIVLDTQAEPDMRNQAGLFDTPGRDSGAGVQISKPVVPVPTVQVEKEVPPTLNQQWKHANAPGFGPVFGLFASSENNIYAASHLGIYRLTPDAPAWTFISPAAAVNLPTASGGYGMIPMAEKDDTLYLVSGDEVFSSSNSGETWTSLGTRPKGAARGLAITDEAFYLALGDNGIFRSEDRGKQWTLLNDEATAVKIFALATLENTVFVGTNQGLYRIKPRHGLEKLPLNTTNAIHSLAVSENNLYVGTGPDLFQSKNAEDRATFERQLTEKLKDDNNSGLWELFQSTDLGNSWTDITPKAESPLIRMSPGVKVLTAGKTLLVIGYVGFHLRSMDGGKTWSGADQKPSSVAIMNSIFLSMFPAVGVDENTVFTAGMFGLNRSTDAGESWQPFMTGMIATRISNLIAFKNALYGNTGTNIAKSTDGGMSWQTLHFDPNELTSIWKRRLLNARGLLLLPRLTVSDGVLYGITSISDVKDTACIFHLSASGNDLVLVQGTPTFSENLSIEMPRTEGQEVPEENIVDNAANDPEKTEALTESTRQNTSFPRAFAVSGDAFYTEYQGRLLRWRRGESEWFVAGLVDIDAPAKNDRTDPFILAVSGETVYVGKRDGYLFRSFDEGNTWEDVTLMLPFEFEHFNEIVFAGSTVYVATDAGVLTSANGDNWRAITDKAGTRTIIDRIAVVDTTIYGAGDAGVYQLDNRGKWEQILPEVPYSVISVVINADKLYIATKRSGMFMASLKKEND